MTGLTSNPTIFDHAIKNSAAYDAAIREKLSRASPARTLFFDAGAGGSHPGRRSVSARSTTGPTAWTGGCRSKCRRCWPTTPPARGRGARICTLARGARTCSSRSRARRRACPPSKRRSSPASRSTSRSCSRASSIWPLPRHICAASSGASTAGLNPIVGSVASVFVSRWDAAVAGKVPEGAAQPARHRHRQAHVQGVPDSARLPALAASLQRRRAAAAAPLGQHGNQGPQGVRHSLRQGSRRALHREHDAGGHSEGLAEHTELGRSCRPMAATAKRCWPSSPRPESMSTRWPPSFRMKAPSRS